MSALSTRPRLSIYRHMLDGMTTPQAIAERTAGVAAAVARVGVVTPLERAAYLSTESKRVWLKREDLQTTGSFKIRGAAAKLAVLSAAELDAGVIAASTGNHGLAVAHAASQSGSAVTVCIPETAAAGKVAKIEALGAQVVVVAGNAIEAERLARATAAENSAVYISPYNDPDVVAGQGTIGLDLRSQLATPFTLVASVGGGGLISGIAATLRGTGCTIVGTSPTVDAAMVASVRAGRIVDVDAAPTLSDGTAGNLEEDAITLDLCRLLVDEWVLEDESAIRAALDRHTAETGVMVEGSAALALATAASLDAVGDVVVVICGGNV